ncbi:hypothetical protein [Sinomonas terrae]|uniref:Uncharacterized protein n=1 Tax=Sinomonas terrae TaxID=2908838 RepID=A0ABS9U7A7_9MICC|nr:hypothetical protein [Sinomonas terrae]MCH6472584.1 hypothetical protein [Sinomonas terrae]
MPSGMTRTAPAAPAEGADVPALRSTRVTFGNVRTAAAAVVRRCGAADMPEGMDCR